MTGQHPRFQRFIWHSEPQGTDEHDELSSKEQLHTAAIFCLQNRFTKPPKLLRGLARDDYEDASGFEH